MWLSLLQALGLAWWIEVRTDNPAYTYYFGPFMAQDEAEAAKGGYLQDLEQEGATIVQATTMRTKPTRLTVEGSAAPQSSGQSTVTSKV
ncbi:MAG: DUF1816 domain-containing protein [Elainellaceae cyanobacterium]